MEVIDHELNRRVSGFRIVSIVIGAISLLNLIRWMLAPTSEMEFVNKAQMIVNLCYFLYSLYLFQYLNKSNYSILLSSFIVLYFSYYLIGNYLSNMDNNFSNPDQIGLGRAIDYNFLFPMTMIVISPLFQRQSLVILSILFFTNLYPGRRCDSPPASLPPIAFGWPVKEKGPEPSLPIWPVIK